MQVCIYTVSPVSRVVFETTTLKNYTPISLQNSNTHSDTRKHWVWVQRRHRDAAVCDLKFVNELQTHTHAFPHVLTHAVTHRQTADKLVKFAWFIFILIRFQIRLKRSRHDKKIREASRDQKPPQHRLGCPSTRRWRPRPSKSSGLQNMWDVGFKVDCASKLRQSRDCTAWWLHLRWDSITAVQRAVCYIAVVTHTNTQAVNGNTMSIPSHLQ